MERRTETWRRLSSRCLLVAAPAAVVLGSMAYAGDRPDGGKPAPPSPPGEVIAAPVLPVAPLPLHDLAFCRRLALERQPSLAAAAASLAAAQARSAGLEKQIGIPLVTRDLKTRREQASLGVSIAQAQVDLVRSETSYNVARTYWTAVYARQQLRTADDLIDTLRKRKKDVDELESWTKDLVGGLLLAAEGRRETAVQGHARALAALREAMGVGESFPCFDIADVELPRLAPPPSVEEIVRLALARRGEMVQATLFAEITNHEIKAQASKFLHPTVMTFASASDVHARVIPQGSHNGEYRPGGLPPEMPAYLVGNRSARVEQAKAYSARAGSLADKTRNLITLEAHDAYLRWQEQARKLPRMEEASAATRKASDRANRDAKKPVETGVSQMDAINAGLISSQLRLQVNETLYQAVLELAALERITAGGYCAGLEGQVHPGH